MLARPGTNATASIAYVAGSPANLMLRPASAGPATDENELEMLSSTAADATLSSGTSRGTTDRMAPIPRQKNDAPTKPSTNSAQTCGLGRIAFTNRRTV